MTPLQRYSAAMERLDDNFADGRLCDEWVGSIEAAVAAERERCAELYQALDRIADQLERVGDMRSHKDGQFVTDARAALAKARGET